jgi:nucleoside-diphosphate-sugar epimerase
VRVAVTGAAGYIGGWLMAELDRRGHQVCAQDLDHPPSTADVHWLSFRTFDLCTQERIRWLRTFEPEVVIHLAALYGRVWGEVDMVKTAGINAGLTAMLARDTAAHAARLMFVSSSEVYGDIANHRTCYTDARHGLVAPLEPMNMYGMSKKWGEEAAQRYAPDGLMITRLNMPYGPAICPPLPGTVPDTSGKPGPVGYNVLHSMTWEAEHGFDLKVHTGTTRCLTWVGDTVRGLAMIMESGQSGIWNVNRNDDHRPVAELARKVIDLTGSTSQIRTEEPPPRVTLRKSLDNSGLLELGWRPTVNLDEGIKQTWEYFRKFDRDGVWQG